MIQNYYEGRKQPYSRGEPVDLTLLCLLENIIDEVSHQLRLPVEADTAIAGKKIKVTCGIFENGND